MARQKNTPAALPDDGVLHLRSAAEARGMSEEALMAEVFAASAPHALDLGDDGWLCVLSPDTGAAATIRSLSGNFDDVPVADLRASVAKMLRGSHPTAPSTRCVLALAAHLGAKVEGHLVDLTGVVWEACDAGEARLLKYFYGQPGWRATPSMAARHVGMSARRTKLLEKVFPSVPFLLKDDANVGMYRLVGASMNYTRPRDVGKFGGMYASDCGERLVLKFTLSEQMVESNSFSLPEDVRRIARGTYHHPGADPVVIGGPAKKAGPRPDFEATHGDAGVDHDNDNRGCDDSGLDAAGNAAGEAESTRKTRGLGPLVRHVVPDYVDGQSALIFLDRSTGTVSLTLVDAHEAATEDASVSAFLEPAAAFAA